MKCIMRMMLLTAALVATSSVYCGDFGQEDEDSDFMDYSETPWRAKLLHWGKQNKVAVGVGTVFAGYTAYCALWDREEFSKTWTWATGIWSSIPMPNYAKVFASSLTLGALWKIWKNPFVTEKRLEKYDRELHDDLYGRYPSRNEINEQQERVKNTFRNVKMKKNGDQSAFDWVEEQDQQRQYHRHPNYHRYN